jgi:phenylacetate-CoA ligase
MSCPEGPAVFRREAETASDKARRGLQAHLLHDLVHRLAGSSNAFWHERLAGVDPAEIRDLDALGSLPFTTPDDLRGHGPWRLLTVPREMTVHADLSRDGATVVTYTTGDVRVFTDLGARALVAAGGRADDVVCVLDLPSRLGLERGGELLGATVVTPSDIEALVTTLETIGGHGLACRSSVAARVTERVADHHGGLRYVVCDTPLDPDARVALEQAWASGSGEPVTVCSLLGFAGTIGPLVAASCRAAPDDLHVFDDHFLPEIVDPETSRRVPDGRAGELTLTTLTMEAMPLLRFRTGLGASIVRGPCRCERTHARIRLESAVGDRLGSAQQAQPTAEVQP